MKLFFEFLKRLFFRQAGGLIDELCPASDVYSLGASFYELLTEELARLP